jgi:predicted outer membrane repeat protein
VRLNLEPLEDRWLPSTLHVTSNADDGTAGTLRSAVQQARKNDIIEIDTTQTIVLTQGQIDLAKALTIQAAKNTTATVSGGLTSGIFYVNSPESAYDHNMTLSVTLSYLNLINGKSAVVDYLSDLTVNNCSFSGNTGSEGGAIADEGGRLTVNNCTFSGNTANQVGGAIAAVPVLTQFFSAFPTVSINNSTFSGNAALEGGAIYEQSEVLTSKTPLQLAISGCSFSGNSATDGGAVYVDSGYAYVTISNSSFVNNSATEYGGAIFVSSVGVSLTVTQDTFSGNTPNNISGPYVDGGGNIGL